MSPNELVQRGKELRNEIDSVYQTLKAEKKLSGRGTDISDRVRKYIPPGTSFDDAEEILRSAGFDVSSRPSSNTTDNRPDRYSVVGFLKLDGWLGFKIQAIASLTPKGPGDYSEVIDFRRESLFLPSKHSINCGYGHRRVTRVAYCNRESLVAI